jgi:hypothetical protein
MYGRIHCQQCGRVDPSLRYSIYTNVVSFLILSHRSQRGGVYCASCRQSQGNRAALTSGLFGWWGIPFGIFWTIGALATNLRGGKQDADVNVDLLRALAAQLAHDGRLQEAREALAVSQSFGYDPDVARLIGQIDAEIGPPPLFMSSGGATHALHEPTWTRGNARTPRNGRSKGWLLFPTIGVLMLFVMIQNRTPNDPLDGAAPVVAARATAAPTATRTIRPTPTTPRRTATVRPTSTQTETVYSSIVTPRAGFGFTDDFSSFGGSVTIRVDDAGEVQSKFYVDPTNANADSFDWSVWLRSIGGNGSACLSLTGSDGIIWYYNADPWAGTWSVDRTNASDDVFRWVEPRLLPSDVGPTIQRLEVRVRGRVPTFLVDGIDVSGSSGVALPALVGAQQPGFCVSLIDQTSGWATVVAEKVELRDLGNR